MPHCVLEYSTNAKIDAQIPEFLAKLNQEIADTKICNIAQVKSRAMPRETFFAGDGKDSGFIFLQISLLSGRDKAQKDEIGRRAITLMRDYFSQAVKGMDFSVTVELRDIPREQHYSVKDLAG